MNKILENTNKFFVSLLLISVTFPILTMLFNLTVDPDSICKLQKFSVPQIVLLFITGIVQGALVSVIWLLVVGYPVHLLTKNINLSKTGIIILGTSLTILISGLVIFIFLQFFKGMLVNEGVSEIFFFVVSGRVGFLGSIGLIVGQNDPARPV